MRRIGLLLLALATPAAAAPPKACRAAVIIDKVTKGDATGKVTSIDKTTVRLDTGLELGFEADLGVPFAKGDTITVHYRCGGPPPGMYCNARIEDAAGKVLVIAALNRSDDLSDGWTSKAGKVLTSEQNPNESRTSVRRSHEV